MFLCIIKNGMSQHCAIKFILQHFVMEEVKLNNKMSYLSLHCDTEMLFMPKGNLSAWLLMAEDNKAHVYV
jgi:hypothetical protein